MKQSLLFVLALVIIGSSAHSADPIKKFPAKILSLAATISGKKIMLKWDVSENESAYKFEIESSSDGVNFKMAALIFGTNKLNTDSYYFREQAPKKKVVYRIKLVDQNNNAEYSPVIKVSSARIN